MDLESFEAEVRKRPLKQIPAEWRDEILKAARAAAPQIQECARSRPQERWTSWRNLFWPCPQAWAGLAAAWVVIILLQLNSSTPGRVMAADGPKADARFAISEERRLLTQLLDAERPPVAERPKVAVPQKRSAAPAKYEFA